MHKKLVTMAKQKKQQLDLYAEMMKLDNPNFGCLPASKVESITEKTICQPTDVSYKCTTQQTSTLKNLMVGYAQGTIVLWNNTSIINWTARKDGYDSDEDALFAARGVYAAAQAWNEALDGRVVFKYVTSFDEACFQVQYGGDEGNVAASAFFPDDYRRALNDLYIYKRQYEDDLRPYVINTMKHELGHVLGLRHEHAHEGIPDFVPSEDTVDGAEAIIYGSRNSKSIMAYYHAQEIQPSDIKDIRDAYDKLNDGSVVDGKGRFGYVKKRVLRVFPDN